MKEKFNKFTIFGIGFIFIFVLSGSLSIFLIDTKDTKDTLKIQENKELTDINLLASSGYAITSKWNYSENIDIRSIALSADGKYIATAIGQNVTLFDKSSNETLWNYFSGHNVVSVAISADGKYIVASMSHNITLFDNTPSQTKKPIWTFNTTSDVRDVAISLDGNYITAGTEDSQSFDGSLWVFNTTDYDNREMWRYDLLMQGVISVAISYNGEFIAAGCVGAGYDNLFLFNLSYPEYNKPMWIGNTGNNINSLSMSYDGSFIATISFWDIFLFNKTYSAIGKKEVWHYQYINAMNDVAISANGESIVAGDSQGHVYLFNNSYSTNKQPEWDYSYLGYETKSVAVSADGHYILAGFFQIGTPSEINRVLLFNKTKTVPKKSIWANIVDEVNIVEMSADGRYFGIGNSLSYRLSLYHHDIPRPKTKSGDDNDDDDDEEPKAVQIPGYNLILIITMICSITVIFSKKQFKK